ncbi:hypothetical protein E4U03_09240 [Rothia nasimurium]|uniref:Uncharacterized protein n=1 Tax=Rothia nasimurium TaxID=85336 RepID=A0A4Y9F371_9MICC|nr:hypothetical protein [Rothia nasimurium]MBF0808782.1 hypothetical protein [Rothia nasimurium]TFU21348.1 hypothetical protein E4U03_09240 [Rothia nasimurium]
MHRRIEWTLGDGDAGGVLINLLELPDLLDFQERRVRAKAAHEEAVKAPVAEPVLDLSDSELEELRLGFQAGEE